MHQKEVICQSGDFPINRLPINSLVNLAFIPCSYSRSPPKKLKHLGRKSSLGNYSFRSRPKCGTFFHRRIAFLETGQVQGRCPARCNFTIPVVFTAFLSFLFSCPRNHVRNLLIKYAVSEPQRREVSATGLPHHCMLRIRKRPSRNLLNGRSGRFGLRVGKNAGKHIKPTV